MKYFLLLSLLLALFAGQDFPSQSSDGTPDFEAASAELEVLPAGEPGPRLALEGDDPFCCELTEIVLANLCPLPDLYYALQILKPSNTPYSIRAPPASTST